MDRVKGKVAIITGAASGMGRADAILLAEEGARVVLTDLNETDGQVVADNIGENALFIHHDVTNEDNWIKVVEKTLQHFGIHGTNEPGTIGKKSSKGCIRMLNAGHHSGCRHIRAGMCL